MCVSGQLKANNTQLMEEAGQAMQNLAQQCSDSTAIKDIVTHLIKILGGKLSIHGLTLRSYHRKSYRFTDLKHDIHVCSTP